MSRASSTSISPREGTGSFLTWPRTASDAPPTRLSQKELIRRFKLKPGTMVGGTAFPPEGRFPNPKMKYIETVDGVPLEERRAKFDFTALTTVSPDKHLKMEMKDGRMTTRAVDLFCPIGKGNPPRPHRPAPPPHRPRRRSFATWRSASSRTIPSAS